MLPVAFKLSIEMMLKNAYADNHCARRRADETGGVLHRNHGEGSSRKRSAHASCPQRSSSAASVSWRKRSGGGSRPGAQDKRLILVDTSVWIDHLRSADAKLQSLLQNDQIMTHPYIRLELALGSMASRENVLADLALLPQAPVVAAEEFFGLIDHKKLYRRGIGVTDLQLICCAIFDKSILIWTRDWGLSEIADELGIHADFR
jgi:predicted nucleic acid-binding protein